MRAETFNKFFNNKFVKTALVLQLLFLLLPNFFLLGTSLCEDSVADVGACLDQSWVLSLNWAIEKHLSFGREYLFTYGPLGFLTTRTPIGFHPYVFILFDLFIIVNFLFILLYVFRRFYSLKVVCLTFLIVYTLSSSTLYIHDAIFLLLLLAIFWLNCSIKHSSAFGLIIPAIITVLLFYIKISASFLSLALFYAYLFCFFFRNKEKMLATVFFALLVPGLLVLLSFPLRTDLIGYIVGGLSFTEGYNDAMNVAPREFLKFVFIAVSILVIFFIAFYLKNVRTNFFLLLTSVFFSYILFKQSFVRADLHVLSFYFFFPALCGLMLIFYEPISAFQKYAVTGICLVCSIVGLSFNVYPPIGSKLNYFAEISTRSDFQRRYDEAFNRFSLPAGMRETIGSKNVDIIPWNVNYIYFNRLEYNPRPVVQSYAAYTPYLINLNGRKYDDESAPDFVIFSNESIDGRYPFFDDQQAKLNLIKNYSCLGLYQSGENDFLLFRKSLRQKSFELTSLGEQIIKLEENYVLPDANKSYFIKFDINYSLLGKALRLAYKPFPVVMEFTLADNSIRAHRVIVPAIKNGVLINPFIENEADFFNLAQGNPIETSKKIKSIRIKLVSPTSFVRTFSKETYDQEIRLDVSEAVFRNKY